MPALLPGAKAPTFSLPTPDGELRSLSDALRDNPLVVLAFFKVSCPVCQFALPFIERIYRNYPTAPIWGVSQDDTRDTAGFARTYGLSFPIVLDHSLDSTVEYDLTNVPTVFVVSSSGAVEQTIVGFVRADYEALNERIASAFLQPHRPLFTEEDDALPALRPG